MVAAVMAELQVGLEKLCTCPFVKAYAAAAPGRLLLLEVGHLGRREAANKAAVVVKQTSNAKRQATMCGNKYGWVQGGRPFTTRGEVAGESCLMLCQEHVYTEKPLGTLIRLPTLPL